MLTGIGASRGIQIGKVYKYFQTEPIIVKKTIKDIVKEVEKFQAACRKTEKELLDLQVKTQEKIDKETASIFFAHIEIMNDPEFSGGVVAKIREEYINAAYALKVISDKFVKMFENMDDEYFRERAGDIKDVTKRLQINIEGGQVPTLSAINEEVILVAKDLTPSDTAQLDTSLIKGFITNIGGRTSHSAIMARSLEIPAVVGTKSGFEDLVNGSTVIINGDLGEVHLNPTQEKIEDYKAIMKKEEKKKTNWHKYRDLKTVTKDDVRLDIGGNIGNPEEVENVIKNGGECIGLFRTEFLYMGRKEAPNEEEQFQAYKKVLLGMKNKPVIVRTLDIGGDKNLPYLKCEKENNPFLGSRALRLCFLMPDIFRTQLRALLRASVYGDLHIMFPMIATLDEFKKAKKYLLETKDELISQGKAVNKNIKIGIMIEVPAAALAADILAKEVDFFSIGTNDLIQYTFAADRMNENVSYLYQPYHPSLLRLIDMVINSAHQEGKWVGMCGEMAGEEKALPLLIGLDLDEFSMSASEILQKKNLANQIDTSKAKTLAKQALRKTSQKEVVQLVDSFWEKQGLG